jgi:hypothetical protein
MKLFFICQMFTATMKLLLRRTLLRFIIPSSRFKESHLFSIIRYYMSNPPQAVYGTTIHRLRPPKEGMISYYTMFIASLKKSSSYSVAIPLLPLQLRWRKAAVRWLLH